MTAPDQAPPDDADGGPDVITFPPVIFITFFAVGYITDLGVPVALPAPEARLYAGVLMICLSGVLVLWAASRLIRARTHIDVRKPAKTIVTDGPYRLSRNPMYLAATMLYAGVALTLSLVWTLAMLLPCLIVMHYGVIRREERYLENRFGEDYRTYRRRVRRWL